jgi:hypothetical protein
MPMRIFQCSATRRRGSILFLPPLQGGARGGIPVAYRSIAV